MRIALFALCLLVSTAVCAQPNNRLKDPAAARQLTDRIMEKISKESIEAGMRLAKPYLIIPDAELESMIGQAKLQEPMMIQRFGKSVGYEFIREERAGEHLLRIIQIGRHERHVTRWSFVFYRTPTGWVLNTFHFDDNIRSVFAGG